jgi:hypothetical protein
VDRHVTFEAAQARKQKAKPNTTIKGEEMKGIRNIAVLVLLAALSVTAQAQDKKKKELNPWIDCGIGAMIFTETGWAAVISNIIWDLGTTAVTSDQSSQHTCNSKKAQTALYIGVNYASLAEETVKGDGKHLHAMLDLMGCSAARDSIITDTRAQFGEYLGRDDYGQKSDSVKAEDFYNIVMSSASAQKCSL